MKDSEHQLLATKELSDKSDMSLLQGAEHTKHLKEIAENTKPKDVQKVSLDGFDVTAIKGDKGEKGDTPQKGTDYFTDDEVEEVAKRAAGHVKPGEDGEDGKTPTREELEEIIKPLVPPPIKGEDGKTPIKGVDYFDGEKGDPGESIKGDKGADGSPDSPEEVREKLHGLPKGSRLDYEKLDNTPDIGTIIARHVSSRSYSTDELIDVDMSGIVVGQVLQWDGKRFIPYTPGSASGTPVWSEAVTGSGSTLTLAHTPQTGTLRLYRNGTRLTVGSTSDYTILGAVITLTIAIQSTDTFLADYDY
jgi:hypothetical protein